MAASRELPSVGPERLESRRLGVRLSGDMIRCCLPPDETDLTYHIFYGHIEDRKTGFILRRVEKARGAVAAAVRNAPSR